MSKIHFLPVFHGDSFVIECDKGEQHGVVVVDGGPSGGANILKPKLEEVGTPDLLVLTHFDGDHIQGLIDYIEFCQGQLKVPAKEVWANCAGDVKVRDDNFAPIAPCSARQGVQLARLLNNMARTGKLTWRDDIVEGVVQDYPFASIEVVSPTEEMRELAIGQQEEQAAKMPMAMPAAVEKKKTRDDDIDIHLELLALGKPSAPNKKDDVPNASSIAFILRCDGLSILMLGDSFPQNVEAYLRSKGYSEDKPLEVDFVKVAHHGSKHNTSNELLDIIKCNHYLISTNGSIFRHPDRDSFAHILCHPKRDRSEKVHLYFNCAVDTIVANSKKQFLKDGEDAEWNFEIHENVNEIEGFGAVAPGLAGADGDAGDAFAAGMSFTEVLQRRYSCRSFSPQAIEQEKIDRILEAGRIAPTAVNKQPVHVWAITNPDTLESIKGLTRSNYGAPLILAVACRPTAAWVRSYDKKNGAEVDASIVATYLMLAAENEGLATLWVGSFDPSLLKKLLPGTRGYKFVAMINVGYSSPESQPSAMHGVRKEMGEFVTKMQ